MASIFQPGVAEGIEGLILGRYGGLEGAAVNLVDGERGAAASRRRGSDAGFHDQIHSITRHPGSCRCGATPSGLPPAFSLNYKINFG